jgi:hypothetical protein
MKRGFSNSSLLTIIDFIGFQELSTVQQQLKQNIEQFQKQDTLIENLKMKLDQISSELEHKNQLFTQKALQLEQIEKSLSEKVKEIEILTNEVPDYSNFIFLCFFVKKIQFSLTNIMIDC